MAPPLSNLPEAPDTGVVPGSAPDVVRRLLLVSVTALIVARPMVAGEDPGLTGPAFESSNLVLTQLWLALLAGWFCWRLWADVQRFVFGPVEVSLLAVVLLTVASAFLAAPYKHPAYLVSWEWLGFLASLCLVRQLAVTSAARHGLFSALLATGVAMAAFGCYRTLVDLPRLGADPRTIQDRLVQAKLVHPGTGPDSDPRLADLSQQALDLRACATFAEPTTFATFLLLILPALVGSFVVSRNQKRPMLTTTLLGLFAMVGVLALFLTRCESAWIALVLAALGLAYCLGWNVVRQHLRPLIVALVVVLAGGFALWQARVVPYQPGQDLRHAARQCNEAWWGAGHLLGKQPLLGVGPGNFGREYAMQMRPTDGDRFRDPQDLFLEVASTAGILAGLALLAALVFFFLTLARRPVDARRIEDTAPARTGPRESKIEDGKDKATLDPRSSIPPPRPTVPPIHWEFYLGGMVGLLLGLLLRMDGSLPPGAVVSEGRGALARTVIWFLAYAVFERNPWPPRACALALATGVAAALLHLTVSSGIGLPAVATFLWVTVGLALNTGSELSFRSQGTGQRVALALCVPVVVCVAGFYFVLALSPVASAVGNVRTATTWLRYWEQDRTKRYEEQKLEPRKYLLFLNQNVIDPLKQAFTEDPGNARVSNLLAQSYDPFWRLRASDERFGEVGVKQAIVGQKLDPHGRNSYEVEAQLRLRFGNLVAPRPTPTLALGALYQTWPEFVTRRDKAREQFHHAAQVLEKMVALEPNDAPLRYRLAEAWFLANEPARMLEEAERAQDLHRQASVPGRRLSDPQREQVRHWLEGRRDS